MSELAQPGCTCGERPRTSIEDGTLMRWWAPVPASPASGVPPWSTSATAPLWCSAQVPDVSFLFRMCLQPQGGLSDADYQAAAGRLGVEVAAIRAVAEVETKDAAFDGAGRPTVLYERHYFRRLTGGRFNVSHPDISGSAYEAGMYGLKSKQYERLAQAFALDSWAALQSVSWGRFQVMGEHYFLLGYSSPQSMALAMSRSEKAHLDGFVAYVLGTPACLRSLKSKNWAEFARGYNGANYASSSYDTRMSEAYAKLAPSKPGAAPPASPLP